MLAAMVLLAALAELEAFVRHDLPHLLAVTNPQIISQHHICPLLGWRTAEELRLVPPERLGNRIVEIWLQIRRRDELVAGLFRDDDKREVVGENGDDKMPSVASKPVYYVLEAEIDGIGIFVVE